MYDNIGEPRLGAADQDTDTEVAVWLHTTFVGGPGGAADVEHEQIGEGTEIPAAFTA